ncbi:class I SAM-dependent methyltransferase [Cyanobium sp. Morenito 9A2]|uniref:class I SAM-dependent methyltransferase n=1 Tax=Cyanobium sp. Morenito 9A2 TaxID=2823718 RepID=UPI0020CC645C|nr:class I SAM-dependent methyltransferase [Cyanobium sp. Morenito 9A2]MCP9850228.1 class I SAM-dependent methyltransferase [Cyanobium sp. Morenito 9A2]
MATNTMEKIFYGHKGRQSHKWHHYLEVYDLHLKRFRNTPVRILEIGVQTGGSLQLWRKYFGPTAVVFGVDIDPACQTFDDQDAKVRIGSQADASFLRSVVAEMGGLDIVVDDGSHVASDQQISFETLFPQLSNGGVYVCEDLQASYWDIFHNGGYKRPGTFIELAKQLVDDIHEWYHDTPPEVVNNAASLIHAICFYEGMAVIEKRSRPRSYYCGMPPVVSAT